MGTGNYSVTCNNNEVGTLATSYLYLSVRGYSMNIIKARLQNYGGAGHILGIIPPPGPILKPLLAWVAMHRSTATQSRREATQPGHGNVRHLSRHL